MVLGEVGVSFPWWCHALVLLAPGYWRLFLNLKSLVHNGKLTNFRGILSQSWNSEVSAILPYEFQSFNFDLKFLWNWSYFHYEKIMRFKKWPQLPGAGRTRARHHHGSHMPISPEAILLGKMAHHTKQISRECINNYYVAYKTYSTSVKSVRAMQRRTLKDKKARNDDENEGF